MKANNSVAYQKAYSFANRIVKAYRYLTEQKREYVLSKQLLRCGTSVGANLAEANGAVSKADFRNKVAIAYKEILESRYWLSLLKDNEYIDHKTYQSMETDAEEITRILYSILRTSKKT